MGNSVGGTSPKGRWRSPHSKALREQVRERAVIYTPPPRNAANSAQQVDTAICVRVLYSP